MLLSNFHPFSEAKFHGSSSCTRSSASNGCWHSRELATLHAQEAAAVKASGEIATQAIFFGLELLGHEPRGLGRLLRQRSRRCRSAVDAEVPKQQATQRTPAITSYYWLTRRKRACLITLTNTASGLSASMRPQSSTFFGGLRV